MSDGPSAAAGGLTSRAVRAFGWAVASFGTHKAITFVGTLVLARILVPEDFGLVAAGVTLMTYLEMALDMGVGSALVYEQEEGITDRVHTAFTLNVGLGALLAAGGALAAPLVAAFFRAPDQTSLFRVMFLYLIVKSAGQIPDAILRRDLQFRRRLAAEVSRAGTRVLVAIPLALSGAGAWSIVLGMLIGETVGSLVSWAAARYRPRLRIDRPAVRTLLHYGMSMLGVRLISELAENGDYLVVGNRLGPDQLGVYSIAYRVPELVLVTVFWLYSMVAFSVYARAGAAALPKLRAAMLRSMRLTTLFAFPAGVGMALVAHDAVVVLFTERWTDAIGPMTLIALALAISSISVAAGDVLPAIGRPRVLLWVNLALAVPMLAAMVFAAPLGITAVALVQLIGNLLFVPLLQRYVNRALDVRNRDLVRALSPSLAAAAGVALFATPVRLSLEPGVLRLTATVAAGIIGALIALAFFGRGVLDEVRALARHAAEG